MFLPVLQAIADTISRFFVVVILALAVLTWVVWFSVVMTVPLPANYFPLGMWCCFPLRRSLSRSRLGERADTDSPLCVSQVCTRSVYILVRHIRDRYCVSVCARSCNTYGCHGRHWACCPLRYPLASCLCAT